MLAWLWLVKFASRTPVWRPPSYQLGAYVYGLSPPLTSFLLISFLLGGAGLGATFPQFIADELPGNDVNRNFGTGELDAAGRLAQVVGAVCGGYVAVRGIWLWLVLTGAWCAIKALRSAVRYVIGS